MKQRIHDIRITVAALAAAAFIALFAVIYLNMAAGNDPALGASVTSSSRTTETASTAASTSGDEATSDDSTSDGSTAAMTTSQS